LPSGSIRKEIAGLDITPDRFGVGQASIIPECLQK